MDCRVKQGAKEGGSRVLINHTALLEECEIYRNAKFLLTLIFNKKAPQSGGGGDRGAKGFYEFCLGGRT